MQGGKADNIGEYSMVNTEKFISQSVAEIKTAAADEKVVMALSGGVDRLGVRSPCRKGNRG